MPIQAAISAVERSSYAVTVSFTDEDGAAVVPNAVSWRLEDDYGRTINGRTAQSVPPASSVTIVLSGDDLQLLDQHNDSEIRRLIIEAPYSSSLGSNLANSESYEFRVLNTNAVRR